MSPVGHLCICLLGPPLHIPSLPADTSSSWKCSENSQASLIFDTGMDAEGNG